MTFRAMISVAAVLAVAALGCGDDGDSAKPAKTVKTGDTGKTGGATKNQPTPESKQAKAKRKAAQYYQINCQTCHGDSGRGDGPAAANYNPKPRDYSDPAWQRSVTDEQIKQILIEGGLKLGKSPLMQPRPELARKPEMLDALVAIIRGFERK